MVSCSEVFYLLLPVLHAVGALLSMGISFGCDTGKAVQTARVPMLLEGRPVNRREFEAAWPWDEGAEFVSHTWNPFALIFVFEWLTAGFALRPLKYFWQAQVDILRRVWLAWLMAGLGVFLIWSLVNSGGLCVAQLATVFVSFLASALICVWSLSPETVEPQAGKMLALAEEYVDPHGRFWKVPRLMRHRKLLPEEDEYPVKPAAKAPGVDYVEENTTGIAWRYAEYCITAPLLFLAVASLLAAEGPAWLFLTGYWLLVACNALGIALHFNFLAYSQSFSDDSGALGWVMRLVFAGSWSDPAVNLSCILQAAWVCLLVPMGGLVYLTRDVLFSRDMPALVLMMIWNLLVTYSMFGIVPTVVYATRMGLTRLAWLLDVLNVAAKFPLPIIILAGFITRPATTRFCYN
jgi:hypothetical protein